jgi:heat shock protein HslJ
MKRSILSLTLMVALMFGISSVSAHGYGNWHKNRLTGKTWYITGVNKMLYTEDSKITFSHNRVNAQICNNMGGKYTIKKDGEVKKWALTTTLMMCDEKVMQAETMFMNAKKLEWTKDTLFISTNNGTLTLSTKKPISDSPLLGKWKIISYDGKTPPKDLFIEFKAGKMFSTTICNNIT